ncbi:MAG: hypothetical protein ACXW34_01905 [Nitrospira sp.]
MMRLTNLTGRRPGKRPKVAVVHEDVTAGFRFADWFARHGYQATLTSAVHQLERNLQELHPDVIVVGFSSVPTPFHTTVPRLRTTCPQVPIIAMVDPSVNMLRDGSGADLAKVFGADVFMCHSLDPPSPTLE